MISKSIEIIEDIEAHSLCAGLETCQSQQHTPGCLGRRIGQELKGSVTGLRLFDSQKASLL